jgi:DNA replication protein DnaD
MDSLDWVTNPDLPEYFPALLIKDRLLSFGQNEPAQANGSIIVIHLGSLRQQEDRLDPWLPEIINTFQQRGYRFVTISELMSRNKEHQTEIIQTASNIR